jgi:uncharacterized membrane protein
MKTVVRLWKHLTTSKRAGRRMFPPQTLKAIEHAITQGEKHHRAEVRVIIEHALDVQEILAGIPSRGRAHELFSRYRLWDTEENCGVLVYINIADHMVEIVADRGVSHVVEAKEWQAICQRMTQGFAKGDVHDSVLAALEQLSALLQRHYPDDGSQRNELPDRPVML